MKLPFHFSIVVLLLIGNTIGAQPAPELAQDQASFYARLALDCIDKEYPNKLGQVLGSDDDLKPPRVIRPAFYGCFDWHSAVHAHWLLVRLLRLYPELPEAPLIKQKLDAHLNKPNILVEVEFFTDSNNLSFERMYGWAWLLKLAEELYRWEHPQAKDWYTALSPLTGLIVQRYKEFLPKLTYPIRVGEHTNTAFGLAFAWDFAYRTNDTALQSLIESRARDYFLADRDCPANWEPGGYDFFSPCLMEAFLMARVLNKKAFTDWLNIFLPSMGDGSLHMLSRPAIVSDRTDGKLVHLDGLNFSRVWCFRQILARLPHLRSILEPAIALHLDASLPYISSGNYAGEHWLATFAVYALTVEY